MPHQVLQSSTQGFYIFADDADSYGEGLAGLSISVSLSKGGGAFNAVSPTITDLGGGVYWVAPLAAHRDTLGEIAWKFAATGAIIASRFERVVVVNDQVAQWGVPGAVLAAAAITPIRADMRLINGEWYEPAKESSVQEVLGAIDSVAKESSVQDVLAAVNGLDGPGAPTGPGGISVVIPVTANNQPVDGAAVWITTDPEGTNQIAGVIHTDTFGRTNPAFTLEAGIFYVWVQKAGINFPNPQAIEVLENGTYQWYTG